MRDFRFSEVLQKLSLLFNNKQIITAGSHRSGLRFGSRSFANIANTIPEERAINHESRSGKKQGTTQTDASILGPGIAGGNHPILSLRGFRNGPDRENDLSERTV